MLYSLQCLLLFASRYRNVAIGVNIQRTVYKEAHNIARDACIKSSAHTASAYFLNSRPFLCANSRLSPPLCSAVYSGLAACAPVRCRSAIVRRANIDQLHLPTLHVRCVLMFIVGSIKFFVDCLSWLIDCVLTYRAGVSRSLLCLLQIVQEYERAIIFRLGRALRLARGPGQHWTPNSSHFSQF